MVAQKKFPWTKLIAPLIGAICGQVLVMVIDSESAVPRLLIPMFALIALGVDRLLSTTPEPSRPTETGWYQAGQPVESEWFQAGRPVGRPSEPEVRPEQPRPVWSNWLRAGAALWDRFLVAMVGPSRRLDENTKNTLVGFGLLLVLVGSGLLYLAFHTEDIKSFFATSRSAEIEESAKASDDAKPYNPNPGDTVSLLNSLTRVIYSAVSVEAMQNLAKSASINDEEGVKELYDRQQIFALLPGTTARFLERDGSLCKVRALSGVYAGESAWLLCNSVFRKAALPFSVGDSVSVSTFDAGTIAGDAKEVAHVYVVARVFNDDKLLMGSMMSGTLIKPGAHALITDIDPPYFKISTYNKKLGAASGWIGLVSITGKIQHEPTAMSMGSNSGNQSLTPPEIDLNKIDGIQAKTQVEVFGKRFWKACPGLTRFKIDLSFTGANNKLNDPKRPALYLDFRVSDSPAIIPLFYKVAGKRCSYGISENGQSVYAHGASCAAVCTGHDGPDYTPRDSVYTILMN